MELERTIVKVGNSAGVLLPRAWLHGKAKITLVEKPLDIKKDVFEIIDPYLEDVLGIYLVGSYARNEQRDDSDVDLIVISQNTKKEIVSGRYHISMITLNGVKKVLRKNPLLLLPRLVESKAILNNSLIMDLKRFKVNKDSFKEFIEECKRIIKINKEFIDLDKLDHDYLTSVSVIYSLILRLRGIYLIKGLLHKEISSRVDFLKWLKKGLCQLDVESVYQVYRELRDDKKVKVKISIEIAEKMLNLLEREVKKLEK